MTINFDLLDAAVNDAAEGAHGYQHRQADWISVTPETQWVSTAPDAPACGTAMCLAGFIAVRAGAKVPKPRQDSGAWRYPMWFVSRSTGEATDWSGQTVADFAQTKAGLSNIQSATLFSAANTLDHIRAMIDVLREHPDAGETELCDAADAVVDW